MIYILFKRRLMHMVSDWINSLIFTPYYIFLGAILFIGLYLLIGKLIKLPFSISGWILNQFENTKKMLNNFFSKPPVRKIDNSRRAFLTTATAFVSGYAFIGSTVGVLDSNDYEIVYKDIKIEDLPEEIKGTTVTLISDTHSGPYMDEETLRKYSKAVNDLNSDIIVIPGDLTNSNRIEVHPFVNAFKSLKAPKGIYASFGNHDYFSDAEYVAKFVQNDSPINLLRNNSDIININGKNLCIMGVEDTRQSRSNQDTVLMKHLDLTIERTKAKMKEKNLDYNEIPKLTLFHKPYYFEEMAARNLDLILSGHTHGGQVVLAKLGPVNISFAGAVSKYISGYYESGKTRMYISRGLGSVALPIRFNCPPEITKITLI
ncbi:MAG TPA: metallophosphoesterase [Ignavibacteria bacterium]|nr:metallophosphoesterase [Ignavibacteria bacterium]